MFSFSQLSVFTFVRLHRALRTSILSIRNDKRAISVLFLCKSRVVVKGGKNNTREINIKMEFKTTSTVESTLNNGTAGRGF